ncbi:hypothetical protein ACUY2A_03840 [Corynebacterium pilbarense]
MSKTEHDNIPVVLFLLSLLLAIVALWVDDESVQLAIAARAVALFVGCMAAVRAGGKQTARTVAACALVVVAVAVPGIVSAPQSETPGMREFANMLLGIFGPGFTLLGFTWAYLAARTQKPWIFGAAIVPAGGLSPASQLFTVFILGPIVKESMSPYHLLAVLLGLAGLGFLFVVVLDRYFEFEYPGTDGSSGGSLGAMGGPAWS